MNARLFVLNWVRLRMLNCWTRRCELLPRVRLLLRMVLTPLMMRLIRLWNGLLRILVSRKVCRIARLLRCCRVISWLLKFPWNRSRRILLLLMRRLSLWILLCRRLSILTRCLMILLVACALRRLCRYVRLLRTRHVSRLVRVLMILVRLLAVRIILLRRMCTCVLMMRRRRSRRLIIMRLSRSRSLSSALMISNGSNYNKWCTLNGPFQVGKPPISSPITYAICLDTTLRILSPLYIHLYPGERLAEKLPEIWKMVADGLRTTYSEPRTSPVWLRVRGQFTSPLIPDLEATYRRCSASRCRRVRVE